MRKLRHREVAFSRNCHVMELKFKRGHLTLGFPGRSDNIESACNAGNLGSSPGSGRSPGGGHGYPLQYSCWENSMDRGAWGLQSIRSQSDWATNTHTHTHTHTHKIRLYQPSEFMSKSKAHALPLFHTAWSSSLGPFEPIEVFTNRTGSFKSKVMEEQEEWI